MFQELGLGVSIEANLKQTDFLDILFNLTKNSYKPYRKPNENPIYINVNSNHPKNIKKQLPNMISARISNLSSSKQLFKEEVQTYQQALEDAGYREKLEFIQVERKNSKSSKNRKRNILWFNPPYSDIVQTNIG